MRESNLHAIDKAIASTLQDGEVVVINRIGDNVIDKSQRHCDTSLAVLCWPKNERNIGDNHMRAKWQ